MSQDFSLTFFIHRAQWFNFYAIWFTFTNLNTLQPSTITGSYLIELLRLHQRSAKLRLHNVLIDFFMSSMVSKIICIKTEPVPDGTDTTERYTVYMSAWHKNQTYNVASIPPVTSSVWTTFHEAQIIWDSVETVEVDPPRVFWALSICGLDESRWVWFARKKRLRQTKLLTPSLSKGFNSI